MFGYSKCALVKVAVSSLLVLAAGAAMASDNATPQVANPYSPAYGHAYRHGAVPTRETLNLMKTFRMPTRTPPRPVRKRSPMAAGLTASA
jgi:serine protease